MFSCKNPISCAIKHPVLLRLLLLLASLSVAQAYNLNLDAAKVFGDPHKHPLHRGSYFGFSVALYNDPNYQDPSVLVGAPRANTSQTSVREPGAVYRCSLNGNCKEWVLDNSKNGHLNELLYGNQIRDNSWLGATVSVENKAQPRVVVSAPRWKLRLGGNWYMNGMCYYSMIDSVQSFEDTHGQRIMSLTNYYRQTGEGDDGEIHFFYGMGQLGFSLHAFSDEPRWDIMMGSPGTYSWIGTSVLVTEHQSGNLESFIPMDVIANYDYMGYSVTSGNYFHKNQRIYVAGAPRTDDMKGRVEIFLYHFYPHIIESKKRLGGYQHGEYFGSSLASCDVNNDGRDELIVGAPLWTRNGDEGRVYIFTAKTDSYTMTPSWIDGEVEDARFGSAVACLGDVDRDGYEDIAVGAPYENDHGAVYIFNGHQNGLSKTWSQRIAGNEFSHSLRGFGMSISEPRDVDGNGYFDVAVGAYISGHAVLLRSQPVVAVKISITHPERSKLQSNSTSISFEVCSSYDGVRAPESLKVMTILKVDNAQGRAVIPNLKSNNGTYRLKATLDRAVNMCEKITIVLMKETQNVIDPIEISASLILDREDQSTVQRSPRLANNFCSSCPVINKMLSTTEDTLRLPYTLDCSSIDVCYSNLRLSVSTSLGNGSRFVVGTKNTVKLNVNVTNSGEPAPQTQTHLLIPGSIALSSVPPDCVENVRVDGTLEVVCDTGNPFRDHKNSTFELDMSQVKSEDDHVEIFIFLSTRSENMNPEESKYNLTILFDVDVDITVVGKAEENLDLYFNKEKEKISFQHVYEVRKFGVTPIEQSRLVIFVPTHLIDQKSKNKIEIARINKTDLSLMHAALSRHNSYCSKEDISEDIHEDFNYLEGNSSLPENVFQINCTNPRVSCAKISCILETPLDSSTIAEVTITIDLLLKNFTDGVMNGKNIYFASNGHVDVTLPIGIVQKPGNKPDFVVDTTFISSQATGHIAIWIIALSVVLGIVLLVLLTLGLIKLGFFNRKKREKLEALKADEDKKHGITLDITSSGEALNQD